MDATRLDQARAAGIARAALRTSAWIHPAHGLYQPASQADELFARCRALQLVLPDDAVFTHWTAARLRRWWLPAVAWGHLVSCTNGEAPHHDRRGVYVRRCEIPPGQRTIVDGVRVASSEWTIAELAEHLALVDLVVAIDAALHAGDCTTASLWQLAVVRGRRGVRGLRRALELVDSRTESAYESILRQVHQLSGITDVTPQYEVRDPAGALLARADLRLGRTTRLPEYDGADHLSRPQQQKDLKRDKALRRWQWERFGYVAAEIHGSSGRIVRDAEEALGLPHDPARIQGWLDEYRISSLTPYGRRLLLERLDRFVRELPPRRR